MRLTFSLFTALACSTVSAAPPVVPGLANRDGLGPRLSGSILASELSCTACHAPHQGAARPKGGPLLDAVAGRVQRDYLEAFIADPAKHKPGTTMPAVLGSLPEDERRAAAEAIADYLTSLTDATPKLAAIDPEAAGRGGELYHQLGCVACHSPTDAEIAGSVPLPPLDAKYSLASLTALLEDPLAVRSSGRMPDMRLDYFEATDIASYLLREQKPKATPARRFDRAEEGRVLFEKHGCAQCHSPGQREDKFAKPFANLDGSKDCTTARYPLSDEQKSQLRAAIPEKPAGTLTKINAADVALELQLTRLNCIACHERKGQGGVTPERTAYFTTSNLNLGEQARIPPTLTGVGAKLKASWLRKVLVSGTSSRPYINTRMPKFGADNVATILRELPEQDTLPVAKFERNADEKAARNAGHQLAGNKNLSCVACHTWKGESATTLTAIDLTTMGERLQEDWFHHYMLNPQQFSPGTIMPGFWPAGKAVRPELLDGDPGKQIDALWQYLARGREARTPSGIKREPIAYGPTGDEAVILRRQYHGIGKRGIGVGYPSAINIAFDAAQLRLGSIWAGDFGEMSGVWRGQGSGNVKEGSREVVRFPTGPGLADLESADAPWPELEKNERPEGLQFKGYTLDAKQRPTFRYSFGEFAISDGYIDSPDGPSLTRTITLDKPGSAKLHLRLAAGEDLKAGEAENTYRLPRGLELTTPPGTLLRGTDLLLPLRGATKFEIIYTFNQ